jgi:hypothetical protein
MLMGSAPDGVGIQFLATHTEQLYDPGHDGEFANRHPLVPDDRAAPRPYEAPIVRRHRRSERNGFGGTVANIDLAGIMPQQ